MPRPATIAMMTEQEYLDYERTHAGKHEFMNGEVVAMSGVSDAHDRIQVNAVVAQSTRLRGGPCRVRGSDLRVRLDETVQRHRPEETALLVLDLHEFRVVNEKAGHEGGDNILRGVGKTLLANLLSHDVAARFGGDEFVILLPGATPLEAALVARRIGVAAYRRGASLSIGAASYPEDSDHPDDLIGIADKNLYDAKSKGRGRASLGEGKEPIVFADEDEAAGEG